MYSVLHSHLTAVAIDFLKVHIGAPGLPIAERGGCGELPLSGQRLQFTRM